MLIEIIEANKRSWLIPLDNIAGVPDPINEGDRTTVNLKHPVGITTTKRQLNITNDFYKKLISTLDVLKVMPIRRVEYGKKEQERATEGRDLPRVHEDNRLDPDVLLYG